MHNFTINIQVEDGHLEWFLNNPLEYLRETGKFNCSLFGRTDGIPPLRPDPALVWQVEGDEKTISRYRKAAEEAVELADRIERGEV